MEVFLIEYNNGEEYEMQEIENIGIFDTLEKATKYVMSCGFIPSDNDPTHFIRQQENVIGECIAHNDYAYITSYKLNKPKENEVFKHHYKN